MLWPDFWLYIVWQNPIFALSAYHTGIACPADDMDPLNVENATDTFSLEKYKVSAFSYEYIISSHHSFNFPFTE
jgi:hypothetical protein